MFWVILGRPRNGQLDSSTVSVERLNKRANGAVALRRRVRELQHTIGLGIGERLEQDGVDNGKDRGVGSDAKGNGRDGGEGESRVRDERAQGVAEIVRKSPTMAHL